MLYTQCSRVLCPCCHPSPPPHKPELSVLCLGLHASGKTTLLGLLAGEEVEDHPQPTMGFAIKAFISPSASLRFKELGGDERIQPYWNKYYTGQDAIVSQCSLGSRPNANQQIVTKFVFFVNVFFSTYRKTNYVFTKWKFSPFRLTSFLVDVCRGEQLLP